MDKIKRVAYIITPSFGSTWSGTTQPLFSLISGWRDDDVSLNLLGTKIKILNANSGQLKYKTSGSIWQSNQTNMTTFQMLRWALNTLWILITQAKNHDIFHFISFNWGTLLSPLILRPMHKKVVFSTVNAAEYPSYFTRKAKGKIRVKLLMLFDGIICLSLAFIEDYKRFNFKGHLLLLPFFLTIPELENGTKTKEEFKKRNELGTGIDGPNLLFVGSDHKRKGLDILIEMFVNLARKYPELKLLIVGPNTKSDHQSVDEEFLNIQKQKISSAGLEQRVFWAGMIKERDRMSQYYQAADILILPTRAEGFPNVIVEAMAAGLPLVVSNLPGMAENIISNGENGYLIEVNNTQAFEKATERLLLEPELRQKMGINNRIKAEALFGFKEYCRKLKEFYLDL